MNKPESLRAHLLSTVAELQHNPDLLLIFIDNGKVRCTAAATLSLSTATICKSSLPPSRGTLTA